MDGKNFLSDRLTGKSLVALLCLMLGVTHVGPAYPDTATACVTDLSNNVDLSDAARSMVALLADPPASARQRARQMASTLKSLEQRGTHEEQQVLGNRARLVLAGLALREDQAGRAKNWLRQIDLDSPVGTTAGQLMAELALRENNPEQAIQWYLRINREHPYHSEALAGLIHAAGQLEDNDHHQQAITLYQQVNAQAHQGLGEVHWFADQPVNDLGQLLQPQQRLTPALQRELVTLALSRQHDLITDGTTAPLARDQYYCLLEQYQNLHRELARLSGEQQQLGNTIAALTDQLSKRRTQQQQLEARVVAGDMSEPQVQIRRQLGQVRNAVRRDEGQLHFLEQSYQQISYLSDNLRHRYEHLLTQLSQQAEQARLSFDHAVADASAFKTSQLRWLAAEALLGKGRLLELSDSRE